MINHHEAHVNICQLNCLNSKKKNRGCNVTNLFHNLDEIPNYKNQIEQLNARIHESTDKETVSEQDRMQMVERVKMMSKTNSKLSRQLKDSEDKVSALEKDLVSKNKRLEMVRNYKQQIESKSKVFAHKMASLDQTQSLVDQLEVENEDLGIENRKLRQTVAHLKRSQHHKGGNDS